MAKVKSSGRSAMDLYMKRKAPKKIRGIPMQAAPRQAAPREVPNPFMVNNGEICQYYSNERLNALENCVFDGLLSPLPNLKGVGVRVLKAGSMLYRGESPEMSGAYDNFREADYLAEHGGLWSMTNTKVIRSLDSDKYTNLATYKTVRDILVLWIPNLCKTMNDNAFTKRGYDFVGNTKEEE